MLVIRNFYGSGNASRYLVFMLDSLLLLTLDQCVVYDLITILLLLRTIGVGIIIFLVSGQAYPSDGPRAPFGGPLPNDNFLVGWSSLQQFEQWMHYFHVQSIGNTEKRRLRLSLYLCSSVWLHVSLGSAAISFEKCSHGFSCVSCRLHLTLWNTTIFPSFFGRNAFFFTYVPVLATFIALKRRNFP